ncbi:RecF/RecN/SMC protein [Thozetella sp. PMI_491]|nr:RecF/RecN/SMC protein [Thozetella sp. PMI_491]
MYIKQIIIQGFKSYKEQTIIEPFSPGTNVIVGRNGSGKSNFFAAIRFVLGDAYTQMSREERQALLHEGSGSAVMSAYVEIIFDNKDRRFQGCGDEVTIRRTIGLKKDEYSHDRKVATRAEIQQLLETAGFSIKNSFYIVPQGRITALTNMKESDRLSLMKEIAGTSTYENRRAESLKIMAETNNKREKIDELLDYIKDRLSELEEEKEELRGYQDKDKEKRCLEYAYFHQQQEAIAEALGEIEEARREGAGASSEERKALQQGEREIAKIDQTLQELRQSLDLLAVERAQLDQDRKETARSRAKAELKLKNLDATRHAREQAQQQQEAELREVKQQIQQKEAELAQIIPEHAKWKVEADKVRQELDIADAGRNRLLTKQARSSQYKTKADRDAYLQYQINEINQTVGTLRANHMDADEEVKLVEKSIAQLEQDIHAIRQKLEGYSGHRDELSEKLVRAEEARHQLEEDRKKLRREEEKLNTVLSNVRSEMQRAERDLGQSMDNATSRGLASIRRLKREKNIPGAYGTVAELMNVEVEAYRLAVEQVAGTSLFHYVVDNERTATMLGDHLQKTRGGRITFMPLEQLRPRHVNMPRASDAQPLISKIQFDPAYERAFQQIFGRTIVCPNLPVASQYARSHGVDAITPEGDTTNKRGAMTGGYVDTRRSRLDAVKKVDVVHHSFDQKLAEIERVRREIEILDQKITGALGEQQKLDQESRRFEYSFEPLKAEQVRKLAQLEREISRLEEARRHKETVEANMKQMDAQLTAYQTELATDFKKALSAAEERQLEQYSSDIHTLTRQWSEVNTKRRTLENRKLQLEAELRQNLRPREDQLNNQAFENSAGGGGGSYKEAQKELKRIEKTVAEIENQLAENEAQIAAANGQFAELESRKADREAAQQDLAKQIEKAQKRIEKNIQRKAILTAQATECANNIKDLGALPDEAFGKYERMKPDQISKRLAKVNEALKKYKHVNKKAFEQYTSFTTQQEQLMKRRKELDTSQESIEQLIEHLDQAKDEAIERTFKQISREFATIFERLVPAGHGRLVIQRRADRGKTRNADESDEEARGSIDNYTGVGISVSFNSKTFDEQQKIQQLSGGQKSLCALCLIFAIQATVTSPMVIFDEVDANLDAQYRTAVASLLVSTSKEAGTQFICTTFRPEIVHVADKCYGVLFRNKNSTIDCVPTNEALSFVEGQASGKK